MEFAGVKRNAAMRWLIAALLREPGAFRGTGGLLREVLVSIRAAVGQAADPAYRRPR